MKTFKRCSSILLLTAIFVSQVGVARAQSIPGLGRATVPTTVEQNKTTIVNELMRGAIIAAMNSATKNLASQLEDKVQERFGIKSFLLYQDSLVQSKYLIDSLRAENGDEALAATANIFQIADDFEKGRNGYGLNQSLSANDVAQLAIREARQKTPADRERDIQKLIIGASTMFTSSISCGGIDARALENTTAYLAAASTGIDSRDIDPRNALSFYENMARFGNPYSNKEFWKLELEQRGAQNEARARQAAQLELTAPGLKAPQTRTADGRLQTGRSLNYLTFGQANAQNSLFNIGVFGASQSVYDTSDLKSYLGSVITREVGSLVSGLVGSLLGGVFGSSAASLQNSLSASAGEISGNIAKSFAIEMYDQVSQKIFQGEVLAESNGCRRGQQSTALTAADRQFSYDQTGQVGGTTVAPIIFKADVEQIVAGETATIFWDASLLGENIQVTLEGGGLSGAVEDYGEVKDKPPQTTTYVLHVTGPNIDESASLTVTVDSSIALFEASPATQEIGRMTRITWDTRPISDTEQVLIFNPNTGEALQGGEPDDGLPTPGLWCYGVTEDVEFEMQVPSDGDELLVQRVFITAVEPSPKTFDFNSDTGTVGPGESATLPWSTSGYSNARVLLDGQEASESGSASAQAGTHTLQIVESNGCGVLAEKSVTIIEEEGEEIVTTSLLPRE